MSEEAKRYGQALVAAIIVHLALCLVVAAVGITANKRPPQILEVTLAAGPPPKLGSPQPTQAPAQPQPVEKQQAVPPQKDDIVEKKETTEEKKEQPVERKQPTPAPSQAPASNAAPETPGTANGVADGPEGGTGADPGATGTGNGTGAEEDRGVPATPPRVTDSYIPPYPSRAKSSNVEGTALVRVLVNSRGRVEDAELVESSGNDILDETAVKALYRWEFSPARDNYGTAVDCYITIPIRFNLR